MDENILLFCSQALVNFLIIARLKNKKNLKEIHLKAIFALIDLKTDQNMKEVIMVIQNLESKMDARFSAMDIKFDARFDTLQSRLSTLEKLVWGLLYGFATTIVTTIIIAIVNKFF